MRTLIRSNVSEHAVFNEDCQLLYIEKVVVEEYMYSTSPAREAHKALMLKQGYYADNVLFYDIGEGRFSKKVFYERYHQKFISYTALGSAQLSVTNSISY